MTQKEVREKIAESPNAKWFNELEVDLAFEVHKFSKTIKGFSSIYSFISNQAEGWEKIDVRIPSKFRNNKNFFTGYKKKLIQFLEINFNASNPNLHGWQDLIRSIQVGSNKFFLYDHPETSFLIEVLEKNPEFFPGAKDFFTDNYHIASTNGFIGFLLAYEFNSDRYSEITRNQKSRLSAFDNLLERLEGNLSDSEQHLSSFITKTQGTYEEYATKVDELLKEKNEEFSKWFDESTYSYEEFHLESNKRLKSLEQTYEELLRLKKPAEYWNKRAEKLKKEAWKSVRWLVFLVIFGCITLYLLLWLTPEGMLLSFKENQASAIKWSIIYVTFLSFLAYGIRALNKIAFSSFHLARDAEEREQLTYVYLSLIKDSAVDEKDKNLIMQSLFSRADTGLLKEDSSPTMPNDITGKIFGK